MVQPIPHAPDDPIGSPDELLRKKFSTVRRGFDTDEVRAYLGQVAAALSDSRAREAELRSRLGKAVRRADQAEHLTEEDLTNRLGEEVAQVMLAAREASRERIEKSAAEAERTVSTAEDQAADIRGRAESVLDEQTEIAEAAAANIRAEAHADAAATRQSAELTLEQSQQKAVENLEAARREGEGLIEQAEVARSQILADMDRRRRTMRSQVELLKAGRDRLLESHDHLRKSLDEIGTELKVSVAEAKIKGESAERRAAEALLGTPQQLESELADAALIGLVDLPDVDRVPDLNPEALPAELREAVVAGTVETAAPEAKAKVNLPGAPQPERTAEAKKPEKPAEPAMPVAERSKPGVSTPEVEPETAAPRVDETSSTVPTITIPSADVAVPAWSKGPTPPPAKPAETKPSAKQSARTEAAPQPSDLPAEDSSTAPAHAAVDESSKTPGPVAKVVVTDPPAGSHLKIVDAGPKIPRKKPTRPLVAAPTTQSKVAAEPDVAEVKTPATKTPATKTPATLAPEAKAAAKLEARRVDKRQAVSTPKVEEAKVEQSKVEESKAKKAAPKPVEGKKSVKGKKASKKKASKKKSSGIDALFANLRDADDADTASTGAVSTDAASTDALSVPASEDAVEADRSDEALARVRDAAVADLEQAIERRLKRVLADEQNDAMEFVRSKAFDGNVIAAFPAEVTQVAAYFDAIRPQLEAAFGAGAAFAGSDARLESDSLTRVYEILRDGVVRPIRDRFAAVDQESDADEVLQIASSFYRGHKTGQIKDHASWMALVAFSEGTLAGLEPGTAVRWAFNEHNGACPDGYDNSLSSPIQPGERFPSGNDIAPIGRHCRCVLVPADR